MPIIPKVAIALHLTISLLLKMPPSPHDNNIPRTTKKADFHVGPKVHMSRRRRLLLFN